MSDELRQAVRALCDDPGQSADDVGQRAFDHLKTQVEAVLASFERDGEMFGRICTRSERADMAAVVASVLVREAARRHVPREFATCPHCGNFAPATGAGEVEGARPCAHAAAEPNRVPNGRR